jgi:dTDP-4-dehydrorhamnose 3,5-epimerase
MKFTSTPLLNAYIIDLNILKDDRGSFSRVFCKKEFLNLGIETEWVQINHSITKRKGTLRGMHFQTPPYAEDKLVRCISGKVYDVIIDLRKHSSTFLKWFGIELSAQNQKMVFIPKGFAHGFQTLENNSQLIYHHSQYYNSIFEKGIPYNDPKIKIDWKLPITSMSERDQTHPFLNNNFSGIEI